MWDYHSSWNQPFYSNSGYWHKCICFTCRKVGSHGFNGDTPPGYVCTAEIENWPRCSRCNQNMILGGPNFKAPKYKDTKFSIKPLMFAGADRPNGLNSLKHNSIKLPLQSYCIHPP